VVIYVDLFSTGQAKAMVRNAVTLNASVVLLDTFNKARGNTFAYYSPSECRAIFQQARSQNLTCVPQWAKSGKTVFARAVWISSSMPPE